MTELCNRRAALKAAGPVLKENTQKATEFTKAFQQNLAKEMAQVMKEGSKAANRPPY